MSQLTILVFCAIVSSCAAIQCFQAARGELYGSSQPIQIILQPQTRSGSYKFEQMLGGLLSGVRVHVCDPLDHASDPVTLSFHYPHLYVYRSGSDLSSLIVSGEFYVNAGEILNQTHLALTDGALYS